MNTLNASLLLLLLSSSLPTLALVPTIAELAPIALPERRLQSLPQVQNFVGAVGLRHDLHHCALDDLSNYQMLKRRERKKWVSCKGQ